MAIAMFAFARDKEANRLLNEGGPGSPVSPTGFHPVAKTTVAPTLTGKSMPNPFSFNNLSAAGMSLVERLKTVKYMSWPMAEKSIVSWANRASTAASPQLLVDRSKDKTSSKINAAPKSWERKL